MSDKTVTFLRELEKFAYDFPKAQIAIKPAHPRDSAKLLIYKRRTKTVEWDTFRNIGKYIPKNSVLVLNKTKVIPARLTLTKTTGGKVRLLYIRHDGAHVYGMLDKQVHPGTKLSLSGGLVFTVEKKNGAVWTFTPSFKTGGILRVLLTHGDTPIPPYIKNTTLTEKELRREYQTVFAKTLGSVAAPTASLHFTKRLLKRLKKIGIRIEYVTLHVGLGTFAPVTEEHLKNGALHFEEYSIDARAADILNRAKKEKRTIVAVGTTALRALESAANKDGKIVKMEGETGLFIREGYRFKFADALVTNFHVPRSSLLMLVAAMTGRERLLELYQRAIKRGFRLFSFGDAMFIR